MPSADPSFVKIWHVWVSWWDSIPYWDPYGAALTLVLAGFVSGYLLYRLVAEK